MGAKRAEGAMTLAEMKEFASFPAATQRYIRRSLEIGLDQSMDASDPLSSTQPVHSQEPAPSSGYDEDAERARQK